MATIISKKSKISKPRITTRMTPSTHAVLEDAASFLGVPLNSFIISAAIEKASDVLAKERLISLSPRDADFVSEQMNRAAKPNAFARKAIKQARGRIDH
jgi:uncharacterized protein (DUF1778 family)